MALTAQEIDTNYARQRGEKPHLIFRYKVRAGMVAAVVKKYLHLERPVRLLDLGCAEGRTLLEVHNLMGDGEYTGIEHSRKLLDYAPEMPENIKLIHGDATCLPEDIRESYYDVVTALALLEHLKDPVSVLKEASRVLRPRGIFIATSPVPVWDHISRTLRLLKDDQHVTDIDRARMYEIASISGLEILEYRRFMWAPVGILPYLKIPVSAKFSLYLDNLISDIPVINRLFVTQCFVARKRVIDPSMPHPPRTGSLSSQVRSLPQGH